METLMMEGCAKTAGKLEKRKKKKNQRGEGHAISRRSGVPCSYFFNTVIDQYFFFIFYL